MADGDSYSWIGGTAGTWGNAANWEDLTTGTIAAVAPGINNDATIGAGVTVYGTGSAAALTALDPEGPPPAPVTLAGDLNVGTLVSDGYFSVTGTLTAVDITIGPVMTGPGFFVSDSVLYGAGTIEAAPGGTITLFADSSGTNTFQLDGNATFLALPNVFPGLGDGVSIALQGTNNTIELSSTYEGQPNLFGTTLPTISTPIQGFNPTDQIDYESTSFRAAAFSDGTLTLTGNFASQTLYFAGDYTSDTFQVNGGVVTVVPDALLPHAYSWIGGSAGVWNNAANWEDLTAGTVAAAAPGIANAATIAGSVALSGTGGAASLTVLGDETVFGTINTGTLVLAGGASVSALDGATIEAGGITISPNVVSGITVDAASVIEMGNSATGVAGALTIDPGNTLSGAATLAANVVDNGLIVGAPVTFDNGLITGVPVMTFADDSLSGTGTIEVPANGAVAIGETAANAGLTFQVDGNALLVLDAPIAAGNTIDLLGNGNTISIPAGQPAVGATIGGFNSSDAIYVSAETLPVNYGDYSSAFYFNNTLTLTASHPGLAPLVYTLSIPGNYASDAFQLTSNGLGQDVTLSPTATNTDSYSWIGGTAGAWSNPSNWEDLTTGALAGIPPGIDNDATIGVGVTVYGDGSAASLTTTSAGDEGDTITGDLNVGTWFGGAFLNLDSGTISASEITIGGVSPLPFGTPQAPVFGLAFGFQGTGTIEVLAGGTVNLYEALLGSGTTFQLDGDTTMVALGAIAGGNSIVMDGSGNTLDILDIYNGATNFYNPGPQAIDATIEGFNTTDVIATDWIGDTPTAVAYANGTLTLSGRDGPQTLNLAGDYSADTFELNNGTVTAVPTASIPLSYSWIGGTAGAWGNAANWEDLRAGTVAASAPGISNAATIDGTVALSGPGSAASLTILGNETVFGIVNSGTLILAGSISAITVGAISVVEVGNAGTGTAGALTIDPGATVSGTGSLSGDVIDNGLIASAGLTFDGPGVSGVGTIAVLADGSLTLDGRATGTLPAIDVSIAGFNSTDSIVAMAPGLTISSATLTGDTLSLMNGNSVVSTLTVTGNYTGDIFSVGTVSQVNGENQQIVTLSNANNTDAYSWIGGGVGDWNNPANWEDLTAGTVAVVPPGIDNAATIASVITIYGTHSVANLTFANASDGLPITVAGTLNVDTMVANGGLTVTGKVTGDDITIGPVSIEGDSYVADSGFFGNGSIEILPGGTLDLYAVSVNADASFQLDGSATILFLANEVSGLSANSTIILDGSGNTIDLTSSYQGLSNPFGSGPPPINAPIEGFDTTDQIDYLDNTFTAAAFSAGTLTLTGIDSAQTLYLTGDYSADTFEVNGGVVTVVPTASLQSYSWIGGTAGTWGNASNWEDLTTGTVATLAPGIASTATIDGTVTISGTGSAASLTILGTETVLDNLNAGTLVVSGTGSLTINAGVTVSAADATDSGAIVVTGTSADLSVSGVLQIDETALTVYDGGLVQAESVVLQGPSIVGTWVDPGAGDFHTLGETVPPPEVALIIGSGGTVSGTGALYIQKTEVQRSPGYGIVNNGVISSGALQIGQVLQLHYTGTLPGPDGTPGTSVVWDQTQFGATLSGTGSVEVLTGGTINVVATVTGSETFLLDDTASLNLYGSVAAGSTILMDGGADTINVSNFFDGINVGGTYSFNDSPPGEFSSPVPPSAVNATIFGFDATDQIIFQGISFTAASYGDGTLNLLQGITSVGSLTLSGDYSDDIFSVTSTTVAGLAQEVVTVSPACFAAGTRIATPRGEIPVESLSPGDEVTLASGGTAPIVWIGRRRIDCRSHPKPHDVWPVRIHHSAFAPGIPCRELFLSPDHAVFAEDVLIPIKYLRNGDTIHQAPCDTVEYFHLELPSHDLVLADGLAVESYLDTGDRSSFENAGRVITLFPDFSSLKWDAYGYAPLVVTGPPVEAARRRIEIHARRQDSAPRLQRRRKTS